MSPQLWVSSMPVWCAQTGQLVAAMCAGGIGALFLVAGIAKLRAHDVFLGTLASYRLLPEWLYESTAWGLALAETCVAVLLFSGIGTVGGSCVAVVLLGVFACAMGVNVLRGRTDLSCGCTPGVMGKKLSWGLVLRTLLCAVVALVPGVVLASTGGPERALWVQGVAGGVCVYLLWQAMQVLPPVRVPGSGGQEYGA